MRQGKTNTKKPAETHKKPRGCVVQTVKDATEVLVCDIFLVLSFFNVLLYQFLFFLFTCCFTHLFSVFVDRGFCWFCGLEALTCHFAFYSSLCFFLFLVLVCLVTICYAKFYGSFYLDIPNLLRKPLPKFTRIATFYSGFPFVILNYLQSFLLAWISRKKRNYFKR